MNQAAIIAFAASILWAESAQRVFDAYGERCPPELIFARLNAKFSLDQLHIMRAELLAEDRAELEGHLAALRASQTSATETAASPFPTEGKTTQ